jgi:hypothetical protein
MIAVAFVSLVLTEKDMLDGVPIIPESMFAFSRQPKTLE